MPTPMAVPDLRTIDRRITARRAPLVFHVRGRRRPPRPLRFPGPAALTENGKRQVSDAG